MFSKSNGSIELRSMKRSDITSALQIINDYDEDDALEARETYEESLDGQFALWERNALIGVVGAKPIENTEGSFGLSWTYLERSHRRSGKGSQMLKWMIEILREQGCRKVFVHTSDYQDPDSGDIYYDAREAYKQVGFIEEIRHNDFYAPGESMLVYGMRVVQRGSFENSSLENEIRITDVDEVPETNDVYWVAWELAERGQGTQASDFDRVTREVKSWGGRSVYVALPSDLPNAQSLLTKARFRMAGRLQDYYEDGVDELHFRFDL
jgi:N-acetylglutamate synthase-like GNAT family acetyltransferase